MAGKHHLVVLDGLRGVAAIAVTVYHGQFIFGGRTLLPEAYLAVDFFFLLSGLVLAYAYEERLKAGKTRDYLVKRAIRLYPLMAFGTLLGALFYATSPQDRAYVSLWTVAELTLLGTSGLPVLKNGVFPPSHGISPLNVPSWSLFFELAISTVYGFVAKYLNGSRLLLVVTLAWCVDCLGVYHYRGANFGFHIPEFWWGFARVAFPFFTGVLLHRTLRGDRWAGWSWPPSGLILALLLTFAISSPEHGKLNALEDMVAITLVYPALIAWALGARPRRWESKVFAWAGALSYPLYIVHYPVFLWIARTLRGSGSPQLPSPYVLIGAAILASGALAAVLYHAYDRPLRAWLTRIATPVPDPSLRLRNPDPGG